MKRFYKIFIILAVAGFSACDYLDVVPDNVATIDYAFRNRASAEKYLFTCYSYRPSLGDLTSDPAMFGSDEVWQRYAVGGLWQTFTPSYIARSNQSATTPLLNYWGGGSNAKSLWTGIRDCNIFLENINTVEDLKDYERIRWIAEVKFLKAYYHYYLFKCYGPIPIVDTNLSIDITPDMAQVYREPVDDVVKYISGLMLEAIEDLPDADQVIQGTEAGRIDKLGAMGMRAELLLFAASPLFNGNTDYQGIVDNRGISLFPQTYDENKWTLAAEACKQAIDECHRQGKALYDLVDPQAMSAPDTLKRQVTYRQMICDRWNKELIWGGTNNNCGLLTQYATPRVIRFNPTTIDAVNGEFAPTLKLVEKYYSDNGVPINEDIEWQAGEWYSNRYDIRSQPAQDDEKFYVKVGESTVHLHFKREPRFYASIAFDKGVYYGSGYFNMSNTGLVDNNHETTNVKYCNFLNLQVSGYQGGTAYSGTGYAAKKMHSFKNSQTYTSVSSEYFPFPIMRLANLYLMYAEALNESQGPVDEVFQYLDMIRARAGLNGIKESWANYSTNPGKPGTKDGLRSIIQQERTIELALEGKRFWDIRRWKEIETLNEQPQGWNVLGETNEDFYRKVQLANPMVEFSVKDYFWPIQEMNMEVNKNLIQNYGW